MPTSVKNDPIPPTWSVSIPATKVRVSASFLVDAPNAMAARVKAAKKYGDRLPAKTTIVMKKLKAAGGNIWNDRWSRKRRSGR